MRTSKESSDALSFPYSKSIFFPLREVWTMAFNQLSQQISGFFVRSESYQRALAYMQGLMSSVERKNGWQVAEELGEATPYAMQQRHGPSQVGL
ncbi:hypothetical protein KSD_69640 [Ktedonobacter sp. SOSP1-85]|uniref:hypothetical protein n=1 Tax=Ktedonobacter sp. SOSP1-85 TaxID=2778367 RepID=UPI001A2D901F|nr:hypothetical protein KSD_69640 [Ktedonobacter sp. SOSP1-85]